MRSLFPRRISVSLLLFAFTGALALGQTPPPSTRVPKDPDLPQRLRQAELIFFYRFSAERMKFWLTRGYEAQLADVRTIGGEDETIQQVEKLIAELATEIANSNSFKESVSTWLATEFDAAELKEYYRLIQTSFGQKVLDFELRVMPLAGSAAQRLDKGRMAEIRKLLQEAQRRQATGERKPGASAGGQRAKPPPPPFQHEVPTPR